MYAPELIVSEWLQGPEKSIEGLRGKNPVYLHFFQVNCPGCFSTSLPFADKLHRLYGEKGLEVIGVASRFEQFEENSKKNFQDFLRYGKLTPLVKDKLILRGDSLLDSDGTYKIKIKHPVAWDKGKDGAFSQTWYEYGCMGTPYEVLINKEGEIVDADFHLNESAALTRLLDSL